MKTGRNILIAFILNLSFSVFEFVGGIVTGSVAIMSDAVHDAGDAMSIGISYLLERISKKQPDEKYTYGYGRYSAVGGLITTLILLVGSVTVIYKAVGRIILPGEIHYNGMILISVVGIVVNVCAALFTCEKGSLNQKAVNLHMLEDVLGWVVVLVGAVVMRFTDFAILDPLLSIGVSVFIFVNAVGNLKEILDLFLEKVPHDVDIGHIVEHVSQVAGVLDVHHIHIWSIDGQSNCATIHVVTDCDPHIIKCRVREELCAHGIGHVTIEIETEAEQCGEKRCSSESHSLPAHRHHHH